MGYKIITKVEIDGSINGSLDLRGTGITSLPNSIRESQVIK